MGARQPPAQRAAVFVGSAHIRRVLEDVCGHVDRVHEVPPGVDIDDWVPQERSAALAALLAEARRDPPNPGNAEERLPDDGNAGRLGRFLAGDRPTVVYFGKLMRNKGVHVLLEALQRYRRSRGDRRVRGGPRRAGGARRRATSCSPGRWSTGTSSICSPSRTRASCRRSSPRRSGWSPPRPPRPGVRRSWPATPGSRRSPPGWRRPIRRPCATSRLSRRATRTTSARS